MRTDALQLLRLRPHRKEAGVAEGLSNKLDELKSNPYYNVAHNISNMMPGTGAITNSADALQHLYKGNLAQAGISAVGAAAGAFIPGGAAAAKGLTGAAARGLSKVLPTGTLASSLGTKGVAGLAGKAAPYIAPLAAGGKADLTHYVGSAFPQVFAQQFDQNREMQRPVYQRQMQEHQKMMTDFNDWRQHKQTLQAMKPHQDHLSLGSPPTPDEGQKMAGADGLGQQPEFPGLQPFDKGLWNEAKSGGKIPGPSIGNDPAGWAQHQAGRAGGWIKNHPIRAGAAGLALAAIPAGFMAYHSMTKANPEKTAADEADKSELGRAANAGVNPHSPDSVRQYNATSKLRGKAPSRGTYHKPPKAKTLAEEAIARWEAKQQAPQVPPVPPVAEPMAAAGGGAPPIEPPMGGALVPHNPGKPPAPIPQALPAGNRHPILSMIGRHPYMTASLAALLAGGTYMAGRNKRQQEDEEATREMPM